MKTGCRLKTGLHTSKIESVQYARHERTEQLASHRPDPSLWPPLNSKTLRLYYIQHGAEINLTAGARASARQERRLPAHRKCA